VLHFHDDTQARVKGLDEILADLCAEGTPANDDTAREILARLEAKGNYIPSSDRARRDYHYVLLKEYRRHLKEDGHEDR
jgi:hypothetical protein